MSGTAGQTVGPFFGFALPYPGGAELVPPGRPGAVGVHGRVLDGAGAAVPDALVEIWQPGPDGVVAPSPGSLHRDGVTFTGWGRAATDRAGHYRFSTLVPAPVDGGLPFVSLAVFARGLLDRLLTRAYLPVDGASEDRVPLLASLPPHSRRTLVARPEADGYGFDIVLQGQDETVFLDLVPPAR